ncbi:Ino eighty subunit 1 [Mycena kentingensis (nom. inval.)]|nr:Ino eighty subunit 1 [Mycena kentingensis (nom. inval.)]
MTAPTGARKKSTPKIALDLDLLAAIFSDTHTAFTDAHNPDEKQTFAALYASDILRSPKASVIKSKLTDDLAKLHLLINVGRVGTTMAFFPDLRTQQRTYHPIPSLQNSKNLLDAPRIKSVLKSCVPEGADAKNAVATPAQLLARASAGQVPPTTLPNLLFILSNNSAQIGRQHLNDVDFLDLFLPDVYTSQSRARLFLWLCYHYHESMNVDAELEESTMNPFADAGEPPRLVPLSPNDAPENVDTEEEKTLAARLIAQREAILEEQSRRESAREAAAKVEGKPPKKTAKGKKAAAAAPKEDEMEDATEDAPEDDGAVSVHDRQTSPPVQPGPSRQRNSPPRRYVPYRRPVDQLQNAWVTVSRSDAVEDDSDDEDVMHERLCVLNDLRGKEPTPEPAPLQKTGRRQKRDRPILAPDW